MCLICRDEPHIAQKDFPVYKVFLENNLSPYQRMDYSYYIGKRFDAEEAELIIKEEFAKRRYLKIYGGFVHSFTSLEEAKREVNYLYDFGGDISIIRECYIPQGTKYYCSSIEIASKSIVIGNKICV